MRYKKIVAGTALFLSVLFTCGICCFALTGTASETGRLTVVIDAGHGGIDGGVSGAVTKVRESDVNLAVAYFLKDALEEAGLSVVMTRVSEGGLYDTATSGYKKRDMKKRAEIIRSSSPSLVVSVHQNACLVPSRRGGQVFYREGVDGSKALAVCIQNALNGMDDCVKKTSALAGDYFILNCSDYPSVIVEGGFLSNAEDEKRLVDPVYQKRLAETITDGIIGYLALGASN